MVQEIDNSSQSGWQIFTQPRTELLLTADTEENKTQASIQNTDKQCKWNRHVTLLERKGTSGRWVLADLMFSKFQQKQTPYINISTFHKTSALQYF